MTLPPSYSLPSEPAKNPVLKRVVIIGGGFSGTIVAVNLARLSPGPLHIIVVDPEPLAGRGVAYGTPRPVHLLNVVARNMSALADQPNHFVDWLQTRSEYRSMPVTTLREKFIPRAVYGDYLQSLFLWTAQALAAEKGMRLECVPAEAVDVETVGASRSVLLSDGRALPADGVVLALGNQAPSGLTVPGLSPASPFYIGNPWQGWEKKLPPPDRDLLLIGTGLTMVDAFLTLQALDWRGRIFAVSRHGLLPRSHFRGFEHPPFLDETETPSLRQLVALFHRQFRDALERGFNPAILVDKLRPHTQRLWQHFSVFEKKQFIRRFRATWNVLRHRLAPEIFAQVEQARAKGRLEIFAGGLRHCQESSGTLKVVLGGEPAERTLEVAALINCTGPRESCLPAAAPLLAHLAARGEIVPDALNMGLQAAPDFRVIDREGHSSPQLFAVGSLLRGTLWETTAVPELRSQAFRLAQTIAEQLAERPSPRPLISEVTDDVLEYFI
jgi:uncharacterized NAD(P)/FAD-binding protein YdhS